MSHYKITIRTICNIQNHYKSLPITTNRSQSLQRRGSTQLPQLRNFPRQRLRPGSPEFPAFARSRPLRTHPRRASGYVKIAIEAMAHWNSGFTMIYRLKMVIFHSYISLPIPIWCMYNPFLLILNVPLILKTGIHLQFPKISVWPIWLLIDPL